VAVPLPLPLRPRRSARRPPRGQYPPARCPRVRPAARPRRLPPQRRPLCFPHIFGATFNAAKAAPAVTPRPSKPFKNP
jgi:hypothetical protein